jgi:hypothetical protein
LPSKTKVVLEHGFSRLSWRQVKYTYRCPGHLPNVSNPAVFVAIERVLNAQVCRDSLRGEWPHWMLIEL